MDLHKHDNKKKRNHFSKRKIMKEQINSESELVLNIDLRDIFTSSYQSLINEPKEELLKKFYIKFETSSSTIDYGGSTRQ